MPTLDSALAFFLVAVLLALTPGPDNVFVALQSAQRGPRAGMWVVLGLCTGLIGHTAAVALGLAAVFATSLLAFTLLKWAGAAYLLYLAWQSLRAAIALAPAAAPGSAAIAERAESAGRESTRMYRRGVLMNLGNPKVAIFFLAFLPQFASAERGSVALQILCFGAIFMLATLLVFGAIAYFSGLFATLLQGSGRAQRIMNGVAGTVFAGLALRLATAQR